MRSLSEEFAFELDVIVAVVPKWYCSKPTINLYKYMKSERERERENKSAQATVKNDWLNSNEVKSEYRIFSYRKLISEEIIKIYRKQRSKA